MGLPCKTENPKRLKIYELFDGPEFHLVLERGLPHRLLLGNTLLLLPQIILLKKQPKLYILPLASLLRFNEKTVPIFLSRYTN